MKQFSRKAKIAEGLLEIARKRYREIEKSGKDAQDRANEAEGAMQSRYDTFKEEGQYLAGGLKLRAMELDSAVSMLREIIESGRLEMQVETIALFSLFTVWFENGEERTFLMMPVMGGEKVDGEVTIITPEAPFSKNLMGLREEEEFVFSHLGKQKRGEVIHVS